MPISVRHDAPFAPLGTAALNAGLGQRRDRREEQFWREQAAVRQQQQQQQFALQRQQAAAQQQSIAADAQVRRQQALSRWDFSEQQQRRMEELDRADDAIRQWEGVTQEQREIALGRVSDMRAGIQPTKSPKRPEPTAKEWFDQNSHRLPGGIGYFVRHPETGEIKILTGHESYAMKNAMSYADAVKLARAQDEDGDKEEDEIHAAANVILDEYTARVQARQEKMLGAQSASAGQQAEAEQALAERQVTMSRARQALAQTEQGMGPIVRERAEEAAGKTKSPETVYSDAMDLLKRVGGPEMKGSKGTLQKPLEQIKAKRGEGAQQTQFQQLGEQAIRAAERLGRGRGGPRIRPEHRKTKTVEEAQEALSEYGEWLERKGYSPNNMPEEQRTLVQAMLERLHYFEGLRERGEQQ